jgi:hypothetical protein
VFTAVGDTEEERAAQRRAARRQLGFYASTPTYEPVLAHHGYADVAAELRRLMRGGDMKAMGDAFTDDMIDQYVVTSTWEELPTRLLDRYRGLADRLFTYLPIGSWIESPALAERWADVARAIRVDG